MGKATIARNIIEKLNAEGETALRAAKALLIKIDSPEIAAKLTGDERAAYLKSLDLVYGPKEERAWLDLKKPQLHATGATHIEEFRPSTRGTFGPGVYTTPSKSEAKAYAKRAEAEGLPSTTYEVALPKSSKYFQTTDDIKKVPGFENLTPMQQRDVLFDWEERANFLKKAGFAGITEKGRSAYRSTFDPADIRSVHAAFDPRFKQSKNILAGTAVIPAQGINFESPIDFFKKGFAAYQHKLVDPVAEKAKKLFTPEIRINEKTYETNTPISDFIIETASDPLNYAPGLLGGAISGLQFSANVTPEKKFQGGKIKKNGDEMAYKLLAEDEKSFTLSDGKGKSFTVAKQAISDALMTKIRGYADGGRVKADEKALAEMESTKPAPEPVTITPEMITRGVDKSAVEALSAMNQEQQSKARIGMQVEPFANLMTMPFGGGAEMPGARPKYIAGQLTSEAMPAVPIGGEAAGGAGLLPGAESQAITEPTEFLPTMPEPEIGGMDMASRAINLREKAATQFEQERLQIAQEREAAEATAAQINAENIATIQKQNDELQQAIGANKIDPRRLFAQASTGAKVAAALGLVLGGIGAGLTGGKNQALETLNKLIDDDIEAQKTNLGKMQSLYAMNLQKLGDERAAYAATKSQLASYVAGKLEQAAARANIPAAQANALQAKAQIQQLQSTLNQQVAVRQTSKQLFDLVKQTGNVNYAEMLPEEIKKTVLPRVVPGYGLAPTEKAATKLIESSSTQKVVLNTLNQLQSLGRKSYSDFSPSDRARANQMQNILIGNLRLAITGPGPLTDAEREWMKGIIANPTDIFELNARVKLEEIARAVKDRFTQELIANGIKPKKTLDVQSVK